MLIIVLPSSTYKGFISQLITGGGPPSWRTLNWYMTIDDIMASFNNFQRTIQDHKMEVLCHIYKAGWWFGTFFIFPYIYIYNHPNWLIFSEGLKPATRKPYIGVRYGTYLQFRILYFLASFILEHEPALPESLNLINNDMGYVYR